MINVEQFDTTNIPYGGPAGLVLSGDGPFKVAIKCFVDTPPPPGFRPCAACGDFSVDAFELLQIEQDNDFWNKKVGSIRIEISNRQGDNMQLSIDIGSSHQDPNPIPISA